MPNEQYDDAPLAAQQRHIEEWLAVRHAQASAEGDAAAASAICTLLEEWRRSPENPLAVTPLKKVPAWQRWKKYALMAFFWILMLECARLALYYGIDKRAVGAGLILAAMASHAFAFIVGLVSIVPIVGPLIVKILSIPIIWLLNSIGYLVSMVAIRRGYSKDVLTYRGMTMALITGIVLGYIFGKLI